MALGIVQHWLRDLTTAMGKIDQLDSDQLSKELFAAARAWLDNDIGAAEGGLRAAYEILIQTRERFYSVDAYIVDMCLLDSTSPSGSLAPYLEGRSPFSILASGRALESYANREPEAIEKLHLAIDEGWADVIGGTFDEADEPLLPLESILWQFRKGSEVYKRLLGERGVEILARRRFALYPQLPQLARRFQFRFGVHLALDSGKFPVVADAKRMWESPDATSLESLTRPPAPADSTAQGVHLPWRLAKALKDDHVATLPLAHWPAPIANWYLDLKRASSYSPVLARMVMAADYFHLTDRPYEALRPKFDDYQTPYLSRSVLVGEPNPISRRIAHLQARATLDAVHWLWSSAAIVTGQPSKAFDRAQTLMGLEESLETGDASQSLSAVESERSAAAEQAAASVIGAGAAPTPGFLVLNPTCVLRRASVTLPDAAIDLAPQGPLKASQWTAHGLQGVVELAPFGFAWIPRDSMNQPVDRSTASTVSVRDRTLTNGTVTLEIDQATGGIRSVSASKDGFARLGQQLVVLGLTDPLGGQVRSRMRCDSFEIEYAGPALAQALAKGALVDASDRTIAKFSQTYRLWSGRAIAEIAIEFSDIDPEWLARIANADPWENAIACRFAWPDDESVLRRSGLLALETTTARRPETPDFLEIIARRERTSILTGGLAHHQRHGKRMLDTILIAGKESTRMFSIGIALDLEHPFHAALDHTTPAVVVPITTGPPIAGAVGWLILVENRSVAVTSVRVLESSGAGRGWGLELHLLETSGKPSRCKVRFCKDPVHARQIDFQDNLIIDLSVSGDAVLLDLTPHEIARLDVTFGE